MRDSSERLLPDDSAADAIAAPRFASKVMELRTLSGPEPHEEADEAHQQEIEVLQSIYGEELQLLSTEGARPTILRLEVPVTVERGRAHLFVATGDGEVPAGEVQQLPPAVILIALPAHYPLEGPAVPVVVVQASYFGFQFIQELERNIQELAEQHVGVFDLVCKLQEDLVSPQRIVLKAEQQEDPMEAALQLLAHNRDAQVAQQQREAQVCPVCFDELPGSRGCFLACGHFGCRDCLKQMASLHTAEADVTSLRCPVTDCRKPFDAEVLRDLLGPDSALLSKWEELSLQQCLVNMEDVAFCPRCDESGERVPCIRDDEHMVYHPGAECASMDDRLEALEQRASGRGTEAAAARAELLTLRHLAKTTKSCPKCQMGIEKSEGCSKVLCTSCKIHFCWRCGKQITGYDHFATSECRLFDDDEIRRWNQRVHQVDKAQARAQEARFLAQFIDPAQLWQQTRQCPRCKAAVPREGKNNHLHCYACMTQFCARCWEILPKGRANEHFNKFRICPQHSDD